MSRNLCLQLNWCSLARTPHTLNHSRPMPVAHSSALSVAAPRLAAPDPLQNLDLCGQIPGACGMPHDPALGLHRIAGQIMAATAPIRVDRLVQVVHTESLLLGSFLYGSL